jgi:hypothetical protein
MQCVVCTAPGPDFRSASRSVAVGRSEESPKYTKAHGAMPNTASQAVSTTHLPCLTLGSLEGAQEPGAAALLESE